MSSRSRITALAAILTLAAVLRFTGLSAGLRHTPFIDEEFFVRNVEGMLDRGDLDHRFHMYPGFFFYLLTPVLAFVPRPFGADAYLAARHVVAAFGVATVALVYLLGARLGSVRSGLIGAAVLAVSPVAAFVAHEVRPDVALGFFAMVALLIIGRIDGHGKRDVLAGIAVGMATAIKYTGVTLAVPYVVQRFTVAENRGRGMVLSGAAALVTYALLSPYSFLHFNDFVDGVLLQKSYHDAIRARGLQGYWDIAFVYVRSVVPGVLGAPALLAALGGLWVKRRDWRAVLPLLALPIALVAVLSTAQIHRSRYFLSALGVMAVLAGIGVDAAWKRSRGLGVVLGLIVVGVPLLTTVQDVAAFQRPSTMDRVLDWTAANVAEGSRIATTLPRIGFDRRRHEVMPVESGDLAGRRTVAHADMVVAAVANDGERFPGFARRFVAPPTHPLEGPPIEVLTRVTGEATTPVDLRGARLDASENTDRLSRIADGDLETRWETKETQRPGMWVSVAFSTPRTIDRVELALGARPNQWGRRLEIDVSQDGREWTWVRTTPGRPPVPDQVGGDRSHSQVLLLAPPTPASAVRIRLLDAERARWGFAEIDIQALSGVPQDTGSRDSKNSPPAAR